MGLSTPKVLKQMEPDPRTGLPDYHGFPKIVDNYASGGTKTVIEGGDGVLRTKVEVPGSYNGKDGVFEWIIEPDNTVNHRFFNPE